MSAFRILFVFFIVGIFFVSAISEAADWKYFASGASGSVFYYDKDSIVYPYKKKMLWGMADVKDKNRLRVWILLKYSDEMKRKHEREKRQYYNDQAAKHNDQYEFSKSIRDRGNKTLNNIGSDPYSASPLEQDSLRKSKEYQSKADAYVSPEEKTYSVIIDCEKELADYNSISPNSVYRSLLKQVCA